MVILENCIYLLTIVVIAYGICGLNLHRPGNLQLLETPLVILGIIGWNLTENLAVKLMLQLAIIYIIFSMVIQESRKCRLFFSIYIPIIHALLIDIESVILGSYMIDEESIIIPALLLVISIGISFIVRGIIKVQFKDIGISYGIVLLLSLAVDAFSTIYMGEFIYYYFRTSDDIMRHSKIIYFAVVIGIIFKFFLIIRLLISNKVYEENQILAEKLIEIQKEHYEYLMNQEKETKKFRHDIKNHMLVIRDMIESNNRESLLEYTNAMWDRIDNLSNHINVNNDVADAILNNFYGEAQKKGVTLVVEGHFPNECRVDILDLSIIISNLLSNALTAELKADNNMIKVSLRYTDKEIFIKTVNHVKDIPRIDNGIIRTTKNDTDQHGYGMQNIRDCVAKYNGDYMISAEDGIFSALVTIENKGSGNENCNS